MSTGHFFKMVAIRHLKFVIRVFEPPETAYAIFIVVQNLVGMDAVVSVINYARFNIFRA